MAEYKFTVPGEPQGKGRPRFARAGNFVKTYTPEKTREYEQLVKMCCRMRDPLIGCVRIEVRAYFGIPKSKQKIKASFGSVFVGVTRPIKKPDVDNILKIIADALNGIAYKDDAQIVEALVTKEWSTEPRVEVSITEL